MRSRVLRRATTKNGFLAADFRPEFVMQPSVRNGGAARQPGKLQSPSRERAVGQGVESEHLSADLSEFVISRSNRNTNAEFAAARAR